MSALVHKAGTALQTGASASPVSGTHSQQSTKSAEGELRMIYDEDGADLAAYVADPHTEETFEAVLETSVEDKEKGDIVNGKMVTQWTVTGVNDDVKRVTIGLRSTSLSAPSSAPSTGTGGNS